MFTKEELKMIFDVFANLETEDEKLSKLKEKMALCDESFKLADKTNKEVAELQEQINKLTQKGDE